MDATGNSTDAVCTAIVPFSLASPFAENVTLPSRIITIGDHTYTFTQHWKPDAKGGTELGFGASVYGGAIVLADFVHRANSLIRDMVIPETWANWYSGIQQKLVLEIGSGLGLVSMICEAETAKALATDGDELVVEYLRQHLSENGFNIPAHKLLWGNADDLDAVKDILRTLAADWAVTHSSTSPAPLVLMAADIVAAPYSEYFTDLLHTLLALTDPDAWTGPDGNLALHCDTFVLAYQQRHHSERSFFESMDKYFDSCTVPPQHLHPDFRSHFPPINVYIFKRRDAA
jgi:hypothetical protein